MSRLRARCPDCGTLTAVAIGSDYECHACARQFAAGLVRVPRAWGAGGASMVEAASLPLPYPEAGVVAEDSLAEQNRALAGDLPERPLVLGGCCCAHVGAVQGLAERQERLAVVWLDAHGDLNTPETSPSGNAWGMPLRMLVDSGAVETDDVALVGARNLDPGEEAFLERSAIHRGETAIEAAIEGAQAVYVAFDADVLELGELGMFMPEPNGLELEEAVALFAYLRTAAPVAGLGFTGLDGDPANVPKLARLAAALGL